MTATRVIFESSTAAPFVAVLRERVAAYFRARGISDKANALMVARTVSMLGLTGGAYLLILFGGLPPLAMLGLAVLMGVGLAGIINGLNPARVYVGGEITAAWDQLQPIIRAGIESRALTKATAATPIVPESN